jgi:LysM repeat protein
MRTIPNALAVFASIQLLASGLLASPADLYEITVKRGETLLALAARHGATQEEILAVNPGLNPNRLKAGAKLRIPRTYRGVVDGSIQCRPGDTLSLIALRVGVTIEDLVRLNRIENGQFIVPGQRLRVPARTPVKKPSGLAGFAQQFLPDVPESPPVEDPEVKFVGVKFPEDASLDECARALGVSKENLLRWNEELSDGRIVPAGVPLKIPGVLVGQP